MTRGLAPPLAYGQLLVETLQGGRKDYEDCETGAQIRELIQGLEDTRAVIKSIAEAIASGDKLKSLGIASSVCQDLSRAIDQMNHTANTLDHDNYNELLHVQELALEALNKN
jgi:broad specificity phosphatase PhoE